MTTQTIPDALFEIKNSFYIGNYQNCINEAQKSKFSNPIHQLEKDLYMYRAYIAQHKYGVVINDIASSSAPELQYIRMLAEYSSGNAEKKRNVVDTLEKKLQNIDPEEKILPLVGGLIYYSEENFDAILRLLHKSDNLECCSLTIQTYLKLNRIDLAMKELNSMKEIDEDCTLTQLCQAWVYLCKNGEKIQDAYYILQELSDKYSSTPMLLNGQASALIALGKYDEAEPLLQEALDKDPNCPETIVNMIVLTQHIGKNLEVSIRYLNQLKESHSHHAFIKDYESKEQEFEHLSKVYAI